MRGSRQLLCESGGPSSHVLCDPAAKYNERLHLAPQIIEPQRFKKSGQGGSRPNPTSEAIFRMPVLPLKLKKIESNFSI